MDAGAGSSCGSDRGGDVRPPCDERDVCAVCYAEFEDGDAVRRLPCGHLFHKPCIDHWLLNSSTRCPVDNQEVCF